MEEVLDREDAATTRRHKAAEGMRTGETVKPQMWSEGRAFPASYSIGDEGPAMERARNWRARGTAWTDGFRLDSGGVRAACAWKAREGWEGRRFHLGNNKGVFDAEVFVGIEC